VLHKCHSPGYPFVLSSISDAIKPILKYISTIPMYCQGTLRIIRLYFRVGVLPTISTT